MNSLTDQQLLRDYTERRSEAAFAELVRRHIDFVYSAALRMVRDTHLAEDVTQGVFVALAQNARQLTERAVLSGWLHRTTQNLAANAVRSDVRRRVREQEAAAMNESLSAEPDASWEHIVPHLDDALSELNEPDRDALLLRYFEGKSAREMSETLGISAAAAQKRVSRAVEHLREFFAKRGVTVGASGLVVVISANAVQAAPVELATTILTAAALAGTTIATTATATAIKTIAMTTLQKALITATLAIAVGAGIYEARQASQLREQNQTLQQWQAPMAGQIQQFQRERDDATHRLALLVGENERLRSDTVDVLKLRGEISRLRSASQESVQLKSGSLDDATQLAAKSWLARVNRLKEHLERTPGAKTPELQFLTDQDWLNATSGGNLDTETDYRRALNSLRVAAKGKFARMALTALKQYAQANNGQFPTEPFQLKPYFEPAVDDAILGRYQIMPMENLTLSLQGKWALTEKAPVDAAYDLREVIGSNGFVATGFRSFPIENTLWPVLQDFSAANPGLQPTDPSQLLPYATTPDQKAALQEVIEAVGPKSSRQP